jgi:uncharacterized protein YndB with AHSA1/START domain
MPFDQIINLSIAINAGADKVWNALTDPILMKQWMSDMEIDIVTDWEPGNLIIIKGKLEGHDFENTGTVLQFDRERVLKYSHLSSLSNLPDQTENYSLIEFKLDLVNGHTNLTLTLNNFPTKAIYHHFAFYWKITLNVFKAFCETV